MSRRGRTLAYRLLALCALIGAVASGALLAVKSHGAAPGAHATAAARARTRASVVGARTIAAPSPSGGGAEPVATVIPPADAAPPRPVWPPPLLNPVGHLRTAWDLALGRPEAREVLFTFDDGPNPGTTDRLLGYLDRAHIKAMFFVCGWRLQTSEEPLRTRARNLLRETFARGHVIGNHSVNHRNMATLTPQQVAYEVERNADLIEEVTGQRPHLFRPPYGSYSEHVRRHVEARHLELWLWSVDSHDWQQVGNAQAVAMRVITTLGNMAGGTVLLHDTHPWSVTAAQMVFRWLEGENRDRIARGRVPYRVVDPAEFLEGARARLPLIEAAREQRVRDARRTARQAAAADAGATAAESPPGAGSAAAANAAPAAANPAPATPPSPAP